MTVTTSATEPAVVADRIWKSYGAVRALRGVSLRIERGEILAVLGPNGGGKTTLVNVVAGLSRPDAGSVRILGAEMPPGAPAARRRDVGMAPQDLAIFPMLDVRDNLRLFGALSGDSGRRLRDRVVTTARRFGLEGDLRRPAGNLSGGERRRLHSAMAMIHTPDVLLLDEPTVGADPESRTRLLQIVRGAADEGSAVCYTTHHLSEVEALRCSVAVLDRGELAYLGTCADLVARYGRRSIRIGFTPGHLPDPRWLAQGEWADATLTLDLEASADASTVLGALGHDLRKVLAFEVAGPDLEGAYHRLLGAHRRDRHRPHRAARTAPGAGTGPVSSRPVARAVG